MLIIGERSPLTWTSATPSTDFSRSTTTSSTSCVSVSMFCLDEVTARRMIASPLVSALAMVGGSASSGRLRCALPTASRRSLAATLMSVESENCTVTRLRPLVEVDWMSVQPETPAAAFSMTLVTSLSIVSGVAPV